MSENNSVQQAPQNGKTGAAGAMGGARPGMRPPKAKNFKKSLGELLKFMGGYRVAIVISLVLALGGVALQIVSPHFIGELTKEIQKGLYAWIPQFGVWANAGGGIDISAVTRIGIIVGVLYLGSVILSFVQGFIMATVTQLIVKRMRTQITEKINKLPLKYFDNASYGDILSRLTNDIDTIGQSLSQSVVSLVTSVFMLAGVIIMMFTVNWIMALVAVGATVVGFALMIIIMSRSQKYFIQQQKYLGTLNGIIEETYSGHNVVKAYNAGEKTIKKFSETSGELKKAVRNANFFSISMHPLMNFIGNFGYLAMCITGALLMVNGYLSGAEGFGVIAEFLIYVRLFSQPLGQLSQAGQSLQSTAAASERVFEFLHEPEESPKLKKLENVKGAVKFRNVKFGYVPEKMIIKDFSADVQPGQKIAIVGPTGAGKTTIVNLLMRFYEIDSGEISIDGIDVRYLTKENIRETFGMVLQDTWMFEGTIRDNIVYNKEGVTEETIVEAAKAANLDHFIRTLPKGYDTVMDDKANLSAGQKQLVTIARAFVEDAPMLILDEATSSVDTRTEVLIQEAMDRLTKGRTTFVIAHRLSTIKNADLILVLKDGDIVENGSHAELLQKGGFYAELYNSQFSEENHETV